MSAPYHPVIARLIEAEQAAGRKPRDESTVAEVRAQVDQSALALGAGPDMAQVDEVLIPTRTGSCRARLLQPYGAARGVIVYLHGGGWVSGSIESSESLARHLASRAQCPALLVDYRLAPEHPFPAGLEDAEDALRWAAVHCHKPLFVAGDSAGANLATVAATGLAGEVTVALQILFYPVTDTAMDTPSYLEFGDGPRLSREDMAWFLAHYAPPNLWTDPRVAPLRSGDLSQSPPAWLGTAECDVLRDEGEAYASRLKSAGVAVQVNRYPGMVHGFARMLAQVDTADAAVGDAALAIRAVLEKSAI